MRAAGGAGAIALSGVPAMGYGDRRTRGIREIIQKVDPLACPKCGGVMKIVSFIELCQQDVVGGEFSAIAACGKAPIRTQIAKAAWTRACHHPN